MTKPSDRNEGGIVTVTKPSDRNEGDIVMMTKPSDGNEGDIVIVTVLLGIDAGLLCGDEGNLIGCC